MFDKEFFKKIGQLLKKADELQLYYYKAHNRLSVKDVPSVLIGGQCLSMVLNRPVEGINFLVGKADPFVRFCDSRRKKQVKDWKAAYGKMNSFKKLLKEVLERVDNKDGNSCVDVPAKNLIRCEYFV